MIFHDSIPAAWTARVTRDPESVAIRYFDGAITARELDELSDALAVALVDKHDVVRGDRVGLYLQNTPAFVIGALAIWKLGAIAVPLNPMYRGRELRALVDDSGVVGVIAGHDLIAQAREIAGGSDIRFLIASDDRTFQSRNDPRVFPDRARETDELLTLIEQYRGLRPETPADLGPDDIAFITYTSGTTGPPKGALNSHGNYLHSVANFAEWVRLTSDDVVLAIAPLFHITGMSLNAGIALMTGAELVLAQRFQAAAVVDAIVEHRVTFTIGSITAFNAFLSVEGATREQFASVRAFYSGGAPIPPATVERFQQRFGPYLHNVWGMTETSGGGIGVPLNQIAPVDPRSGSLSIGKPAPNAVVRILAADGSEVPFGEEGELEFAAPQVVSGYWLNPEATASTFPGGRLRTGDVAVVDEQGWVYLVDRLKDLINVSGFKVWPREVEDVLYEHPAVFEAAVVGEPDEYRGETVVAYVSLNAGAGVQPDELVAFAKERLAAYKYPRRVEIVDALPKTLTGKIRRRDLRKTEG